MKSIFIVLLVCNIAFFGFQIFGGNKTAEVPATATAYRQVGNLQTLAEHNAKNKITGKEIPKKMPEVVSVSSSPEGGEPCELVGPFAELIHAENLVERLTAKEITAMVKQIEIVDGKKFWVYLKPEVSEKEALRRLYEVQAKNIDDSYIIPSGDLANGISFGQFGDEKEAKAKAEQIHSLGYEAQIKEIPKGHTEAWVEIKEKTGHKVSPEQWLDFLKEEKGLERRQNYCFSVAK